MLEHKHNSGTIDGGAKGEVDLTTGDMRLDAARQYFLRQAEEKRDFKPTDRDFELHVIRAIREYARYFEAVYDERGMFVHVSKSLGLQPEVGAQLKIFGRYSPRGADLIDQDGKQTEIYYRTPDQQSAYMYEIEAHRREVRGDNC